MKAFVFLNGRYLWKDYPKIEKNALIIAVDGGANYLFRLGIVPDIFVGDGDSVQKEVLDGLSKKGVSIFLYPEDKDEIDAELAIKKALEFGANEIIIHGWRGERLDMMLALISIMSKQNDVKIVAKDHELEMGVVCDELVLESKAGEKWSILPVCGNAKCVTLSGFKYEINCVDMPCEKPFGISNIAKKNRVKISVKEGKVVYFRWIIEPS